MKKLLSILLLCFCFFASAQEIAPNFIVTDIYGETHELYEYLNQDKYVVVNFMGTWSGPDQVIAQDFGLGFIEFGCNNFDVIFISIDTGSDTQACLNFEDVYMPSVQGLPLVSGNDGGGDAVHQAYDITAVPTIVTISPGSNPTYTETHLGFNDILADAGIFQVEPWDGCYFDSTAIINGCTDPGAFNYSIEAVIDDGSCDYYMLNDYTLNELEGSVFSDQPEVYAYFSYLIDSLSNQIQVLQEALISETLDDEIVSDANSFDVLNPLSYNGEFQVIQHDFINGEYIVPNGKTLLIKTIHSKGDNATRIEIDGAELTHVYNEANTDFVNDIVIGSNKSINSLNPSWEAPGSNSNTTFTGVLINKTIETIHHAFTGQVFTVPPGKTLVINQILLGGNSLDQELYLNNLPLFKLTGYSYGNNKKNNLFIGENQTIGSEYNTNFSFHGYLINNSNYTYATDYELIDALNEGMDSLSTMSQMVVLENDSISSQNAILSQENEALMAIDYNFDSLQYVADFLSSQVFELQQELLVPNIDVDMAIGWNMVGFSCPQQKNVEGALLSIVDKIIIFKDNSGNVYMPEFSFNGIGDLTPGHGYQLKVTDYILDFNICE